MAAIPPRCRKPTSRGSTNCGCSHVDAHRLYVHAGVDAGIPLEMQSEKTLLWKRYPKHDASGFGGLHVVHGHDNDPEGPLLYEGRTNLDTAAWKTGRLTVGVFDDDRPGGPVDLIVVRGAAPVASRVSAAFRARSAFRPLGASASAC